LEKKYWMLFSRGTNRAGAHKLTAVFSGQIKNINILSIKKNQSFCPHSGQNFVPEGTAALHCGHFRKVSTFVPHSGQNFAPGMRAAPQFVQADLPAGTIFCPHSGQNFVPAGTFAPQLLHVSIFSAGFGSAVWPAPGWPPKGAG
jgi:hypothetical protein